MRIRLAACLLSAALCLCACGGQTQPVSPTQTPPPQTAAPVEESSPQTPEPTVMLPEPADTELVRVRDWLPDLPVELRYAGEDNFTGTVVYDFSDAWLRYGTVKKLQAVRESLLEQGYDLLIWDAYRPVEAQYRLWEAVPDPVYVANPYAGHSTHSNGGTVDLSLVSLDGSPVEMPSAFDEFGAQADRNYGDVSLAAGEHAQLLERAMTAAGFVPYAGEWWHYSDSTPYDYEDLEQIRLPADAGALYRAAGGKVLSLRAGPGPYAQVLLRVPAEASFPILGFAGEDVRVRVDGQEGYLRWEDLCPTEDG